MINPDTIFSKEALDKLRSPEQLDKMLPITTPVGWMALAGMVVLMLSVAIWSVFGAFTVKVDGMGIITDSAGLYDVTHMTSGKIRSVYVQKGDTVKEGQLVARMELPAVSADTDMARQGMNLAASDRDAMDKVYQYDVKKQQQVVQEYIYSEHEGIVDEVMAEAGSLVNAGSPLMTIRRTQEREELTGTLYVPLDKAKLIKPGMTIQLTPSGADSQKTGSLLGVVRSVSQYPVFAQSMRNSLAGNDQLANYFLNAANGAAMEVKFDLVRDESSDSGYLWTSVVGKQPPVMAGSSCMGSIVVDREPPISRVFYKLSQWLRNR